MFFESSLRKFILHDTNVDGVDEFYFRYVYVEDRDDIVEIHHKPWSPELFQNATNQKIIIAGDQNMFYPNGRIFRLLQHAVKFNGLILRDPYGLSKTYLGIYDLSLQAATRTNQFSSLLPHIRSHDKIWLNDLTMQGSSTYFIDLFDVKLWIAFLAMFALIGLISATGIFLLKKFTKDEIDHLTWFSIVVNQGANENSTLISRRLLLISLSIVTIMFYGAFEAFMSSVLAVRHPDLPFSDVASLLKLPSYTVCALPNTAALEQITYDAANLKHSAMISSDACPNIFRYYDGTRNSIQKSEMSCPKPKMVYIGPGMCFFPKMSEMCPMSSLRGKYFHNFVTIVKHPGFKYSDQLNQGILRLRSSGHLEYMVQQFNLRQLHLTCSKQFIAPETDVQVNFFQVRLLLLIILIGLALSTITAVVELIYNRM